MNSFRKYFFVIGISVSLITVLRGTLNADSVGHTKHDGYAEFINTDNRLFTRNEQSIPPNTSDLSLQIPTTSVSPIASDSSSIAPFLGENSTESSQSSGASPPNNNSIAQPEDTINISSHHDDTGTDTHIDSKVRGHTGSSGSRAHSSSSRGSKIGGKGEPAVKKPSPTSAEVKGEATSAEVETSASGGKDEPHDEAVSNLKRSFESLKQIFTEDIATRQTSSKELKPEPHGSGGRRSDKNEPIDPLTSAVNSAEAASLVEEKKLLDSFKRLEELFDPESPAPPPEIAPTSARRGGRSNAKAGNASNNRDKRDSQHRRASPPSRRGGPRSPPISETPQSTPASQTVPAPASQTVPEEPSVPASEPESKTSEPSQFEQSLVKANEQAGERMEQITALAKPEAAASAADSAGEGSGEAEEEEEEEENEGVQVQDMNDPEVRAILEKRKKHNGPYFSLLWPPKKAKNKERPVHLRLHLRQFFEDGSFGVRYGAGEKTAQKLRPHLDYVSEGNNGQVLTRYTYNAAMLPFLPREDASWNHTTCAVVSNSGEVLRNDYGEEIDKHDAVFRINYPPVEGYKKHVGSKCTYEVANMHHIQLIADAEHPEIPRGTRTFRAPQGKPMGGTATLVLWESTDLITKWRYATIPKLLQRHPPPHTVILSPDLVTTAQAMFAKLEESVARPGESCRAMSRRQSGIGPRPSAKPLAASVGCKPTSGWFALAFASQICQEVHMYGFSKWRKHAKGLNQAPYHYFDHVNGTTNVHSFDLSFRMYEELTKHYPVFLH